MRSQLTIGYVIGSHGVRGELKVRSTSGEMAHFSRLARVTLRRKDQPDREYAVTGVRGKPDAVIMAVDGISDPETARTLKGSELVVPREAAASLTTGEYYVADLVGCRLVCQDSPIAEVTAVWNNGFNDMFDVQLQDGTRRTVPFLEKFIGEVDIINEQIELKHDWILE